MAYENQRKAKIAVKSSTLQHDVRSIAREASAAPAASFKRRYRTSEIDPIFNVWPRPRGDVISGKRMKKAATTSKNSFSH
jgi:hypothetical protein